MSKVAKVCFIAPSTRLVPADKPLLDGAVRLIGEALGTTDIFISPFLFTADGSIRHVTATAAERSEEFKTVIRDYDLIASVAGGTGAEDIVPLIDRQDWRVIRKRRPLFLDFSDFTFMLSEVYARTGIPGVLFPSLSLGRGHARRILALLSGCPVSFRGSFWLTPPPAEPLTGIPVGGNLTTFVNFLNREKPPRLSWRNHILFIEDVGIDIEDLHRLLAALRRHRVFALVRGVVVGTLCQDATTPEGREFQAKALKFLTAFLNELLRWRRKAARALPILVAEAFSHRVGPRQPAVPIGGAVTITPDGMLCFQLPGSSFDVVRIKQGRPKTGDGPPAPPGPEDPPRPGEDPDAQPAAEEIRRIPGNVRKA
ncbi:MAG: LD-carboxypeptidase [Candidatus Aminicenantes bacterium]|nr:LD-carboxypeptidase [Candidatus Aminicenantes bacterium]